MIGCAQRPSLRFGRSSGHARCRIAESHVDLTAQAPQHDLRIVLAREPPFRLGSAEVRPDAREVAGPRGRELLEPRVMQVLVVLAKAQGGVVTRDQLIALCWDGRSVSEDAISRVIARIRRLSEGRLADG